MTNFHAELAKLCTLAYLPAQVFDNESLVFGKAYPDCEYVIYHQYNKQVIAIRGSSSLTDWALDTKFRKVPYQGLNGKVHEGFLIGARHLKKTLIEKRQLGEQMKLVITGHSLGGALAIVLAQLMKGLGWPIQEVVTFGCPMVGDDEFCEGYAQALGRFTTMYAHRLDIVPRLPGRLFGYRTLPVVTKKLRAVDHGIVGSHFPWTYAESVINGIS